MLDIRKNGIQEKQALSYAKNGDMIGVEITDTLELSSGDVIETYQWMQPAGTTTPTDYTTRPRVSIVEIRP